jgi:hypothetical protein
MARPSFVVQHLIFCTSVEYPDVLRPLRQSTLNGVDFVFEVPPGTEPPVEPDEFWLYARFYSTSDRIGDTRPLTLTCLWLDGPTGRPARVWSRRIGRINFRRPRAVFDRAWTFRNIAGGGTYRFPGFGRYELRLWYRDPKTRGRRVKAQEFISVEVKP